MRLCTLQATRGGRVKLATIAAPEMEYDDEEKGDALHAMEVALAMERLNLQVSQPFSMDSMVST